MNISRLRRSGAAAALLAVLSLLPATAAQALVPASTSAQAQGRLVEYERLGLALDVDAQLDAITSFDAELGAAWTGLVHDWNDWLYHYKVYGSVNPDVLPGDLPALPDQGAGHAFVLLGQKLNSDGTAAQQLVDRLRVTKAALDAYPQAHVLVTGGHTAGADKASEGEVMRDWLLAQGVSRDRILVETNAGDTPDNATMGMPIVYGLKADDDGVAVAPGQIRTVSVITGLWHTRRGNVLIDEAARLIPVDLHLDRTITLVPGPTCLTTSCSDNTDYVNPPGYPNSSERNLIAQNVAKVANNLTKHAPADRDGPVTGVDDAYGTIRQVTNTSNAGGLRSSVAKVVYLLRSGFAGDDTSPRTNTADVARAVVGTGDTSATYAAELGGFARAWDAAMRPMTVSDQVPADLPRDHHAFVMMGADSGTGTAMGNRIEKAVEALGDYPGSIVVVAGNQAELTAGNNGLLARGVDPARIKVAQASSNAQQGAVNAMNLLYGLDGAVTSYTLIVSGNYLRRPTVLFAAAELQQRQARRADFRIVPQGAIAETSTGTPDAALPSDGSIDQIAGNAADIFGANGEYNTWKSAPPALSSLTGLTVTSAPGRTGYIEGEAFDPAGLTVSATLGATADDPVQRTIDVTDDVTLSGTGTDEPGEHAATVTYTYRGVTRTATVPFQVTPALPSVSIGLSSTVDGGWHATGTTATVSASPSSMGRPVTTVEYSLDAGAWSPYARPVVLPLGTHELRARATDSAGRVSQVVSTTVKVGPHGAPAIRATATTVRVGQRSLLRATVTAVGGTVGSGTLVAREGSVVIASASVSEGSASLTLPARSAGTHRLTLAYAPVSGGGLQAATATATLTVTKARATITRVKRAKGALRRGAKATLKVRLKGVKGVALTGKVTLKVGTKKVGVAKVRHLKGKKYQAVVRGKLRRKGALVVVYRGSASYAKAKTRTHLKVR